MKETIKSDTAILLFTRTASEEAAVKVLAPHGGAQATQRIVQAMILAARRTAQKTGLPLLSVSSVAQRGSSFGQRLANALEQVFAQGYHRVLAIGNDSPGLNTQLLQAAAAELCQRGLVIGPSADGGAYLIGISQEHYVREAFIGLPWETDRLGAALEAYAISQGEEHARLPLLEDADTADSLRRAWQSLPMSHLLRARLSALLFPPAPLPGVPLIAPASQLAIWRFRLLRAPPSV